MNENALRISKLRICNFRSIVDQTIQLDDLNVFVGNNDQGKSNIVRALDIFFNGTGGEDRHVQHRFEVDHNMFAHRPGSHQAREIAVELTIQPPLSYSDGRPISWKRIWRAEGYRGDRERMKFCDGEAFPSRSKIPSLLNSVRYEYVPAIKGNEYFGRLLGDLHDILASTVETEMHGAAQALTESINAHTAGIQEELAQLLGLNSRLELPTNLRDLFTRLDFSSAEGDGRVSFHQRGDGIKVRHVPAILNFIAKQANLNRAQGRPTVYTIWGYEEPENNLELSNAMDLAASFAAYAADIQVLITTHSPAFYGLGDQHDSAKLFHVSLQGTPPATEVAVVGHADCARLDVELGLLPFVTPYVAEAERDRERLRRDIEELAAERNPTIFVEGLTDKRILEKAIIVIDPDLANHCTVRSQRGAGVDYVRDKLIAWAHDRRGQKAMGVFDNDHAGETAKSEANAHDKVARSSKVKSRLLDRPPHIQQLRQRGIRMPTRIEELFPLPVWEHALAQGWLATRDNLTVTGQYSGPDALPDELQLFVRHEVPLEQKEQFAAHVCSLDGTPATEAFRWFGRLLARIRAHFAPGTEPPAEQE